MASEQKEFFKTEPMNVQNVVKVNNLAQITNPIFFTGNNVPTVDGLLSNVIFGISKDDRSNIFAYIDLGDWFLNPLFYNILSKLDGKIALCVHGLGSFKIVNGKLTDDEEGDTGLEFLHDHFNELKFAPSDSIQRKANIKFLEQYKDRVWTRQFIVIPAYYRDVSTTDRYVGVGDINKMYNSLIMYSKSMREFDAYGITIKDTIKGKIQDKMVEIYKYFTRDTVSGKLGLLRRAASSKTTDYSARLVMSAPNLKVENIEDFMVDTDHCAIPLAAAIVNFYPYILAYVRTFFANNYQNNAIRTLHTKKGDIQVKLKDYRIAFSDDVLKEQLDRFVHGFSDRFIPILLPLEDNKAKIKETTIAFKGHRVTEEEIMLLKNKKDIGEENPEARTGIVDRPMTWCDLFYMAAVQVTKDKTVLITRYPIDSCYNQFPSLINVSSTHETEPMLVDGEYYKFYPKIRKEDIGTNTSNKFIDTISISNIYLGSIGGDYDGDQVTSKSIFTIEANQELREQINSKKHYISLAGTNIMETTNEGAMVLFALTMDVGDGTKFTDPKF